MHAGGACGALRDLLRTKMGVSSGFNNYGSWELWQEVLCIVTKFLQVRKMGWANHSINAGAL